MSKPSADNAGTPKQFGRHQGVWDGEFLTLSLDGEISEPEALALLDLVRKFEDDVGNFGLILHALGSVGFPPETRKTISASTRSDRPPFPTAVIGTSLVTRAVLTLLVNAIRLTSKVDIPVRFFATKEESVGWLRERVAERALLVARAAASK